MKTEIHSILKRLYGMFGLVFLFTLIFISGKSYSSASAAESVCLNVKEVSIVKDDTFRLRVYNVPKNAKVMYKSTNPSVAFVDGRGYITGMSNGECIVTATVVIGGTASDIRMCNVTVGPAAISIKLTKSEIVLGVGMKKTLKTIISPLNTVEKPIFYSADKLVASVTSIGRVRAKGVGETSVFAFLMNGESAECQVYVLDEEDYERYNETGTLVGIIEGYDGFEEDKNTENDDTSDNTLNNKEDSDVVEDTDDAANTSTGNKEQTNKSASEVNEELKPTDVK